MFFNFFYFLVLDFIYATLNYLTYTRSHGEKGPLKSEYGQLLAKPVQFTRGGVSTSRVFEIFQDYRVCFGRPQ